MKTPLKLIRLEQNEHATFGLLQDAQNNKLCVTLELPWKNNAHGESCIPPGSYIAKRRYSPKHHGDVFELQDVPDRQNIEIHVGNFASDTEGCILVGTAFANFGDERGISGSRAVFDRLMDDFEGVDSFPIDVMNPFPVAT